MTSNLHLFPRRCANCGCGMREGFLSEGSETFCSSGCAFGPESEYQKYLNDWNDDGEVEFFWTEWHQLDWDICFLEDGTEVESPQNLDLR